MAKTPRGSRRKTTRSHTTAIPAVEHLLKSLNRWDDVSKVSLGVIKAGLRPATHRIKINVLNDKVLLMKVRGIRSVQEVRVYSNDSATVEKRIERVVRKKGWSVT